jgi:hypothetical protein
MLQNTKQTSKTHQFKISTSTHALPFYMPLRRTLLAILGHPFLYLRLLIDSSDAREPVRRRMMPYKVRFERDGDRPASSFMTSERDAGAAVACMLRSAVMRGRHASK